MGMGSYIITDEFGTLSKLECTQSLQCTAATQSKKIKFMTQTEEKVSGRQGYFYSVLNEMENGS